MDRAAFSAAAKELGLELSEARLDSFSRFEEALYRANEVLNLTRVPKEDCWRRHFIDSLLIASMIPEHASVLDIGTGPGFPAWPLACARDDLSVTALDSSGKMLGFLREQPLPNLRVIQERAEDWGVREEFDFVSGRALAPLPIQLELSAASCKIGGLVVPMRTPADHESFQLEEYAELGLRFKETQEQTLPGGDEIRAFPIYEKVARTPKTFPRKWAEMRKKPLGSS